MHNVINIYTNVLHVIVFFSDSDTETLGIGRYRCPSDASVFLFSFKKKGKKYTAKKHNLDKTAAF